MNFWMRLFDTNISKNIFMNHGSSISGDRIWLNKISEPIAMSNVKLLPK